MTIAPGATSNSIQIGFYDDAGLPLTGKVAADFPTVSYQKSGANAAVTISLSDLAALTTAWASGGVKEIGNGHYRLDVPDAAFTTATRLDIGGDTTGKHVIAPPIDVQTVAADAKAINGDATAAANLATALHSQSTIGTSTYAGADTSGTTTLLTRIPGTVQPQTGDSFARLGAPVGASISADIAALQTTASNINNLSALANLKGPNGQVEIPASGSLVMPYVFVIKDTEGHLEDLSTTPTITAANGAGTDRSANLSAVTHAGTGQYTFTYTVSSAHVQEGIIIKASGSAASDSTTRLDYLGFDAVAVDQGAAISSIQTTVNALRADYTTARATKIDNLDATISSRGTSTLTQAQVTGGGYAINTDSTGRVNHSPSDAVPAAKVKQALLASYSSQVLSLIPVTPALYLRMDATSGTTETNIGTGATNGTYSGGIVLAQPGATADGDFAATFGTSNALLQGTGLNMEDGATYSIHFLVNPAASQNGYIFLNDDGSAFQRYRVAVNTSGGNEFIYVNGFQGPGISPLVTTDVTIVANTATGSIYFNGILVAASTNFKILTPGSGSTVWSVGNNIGGTQFPLTATIDEFFVVRFALNQDQVQAVNNARTSTTLVPQATVSAAGINSLVSQIIGAGYSTNPAGNGAVVNRSKLLPFFCASRYERVVTIGIGDSNEEKDSYGWMGGIANALRLSGGLWGSGLISAGSTPPPASGFAVAGGGGHGAGLCGAATGAPAALDALMPQTSQGATPQYSYTAAGNIPDAFIVGSTAQGVWFPGLNENLRVHLGTGVHSGWAGTFTLGARWNQSGPESNFGRITITPTGAISTAGGSDAIIDQSWDIPAGTLGGTEQIRFDFGNGDVNAGGAGSGPFYATYWQLERADQRTGFCHSILAAAGGQPTKLILQALQAFGTAAIAEYFRQAMLYAGPTKLCCIRICEGFNDRTDATASWNKTNSTFSGPNGSTQQGFQNNTEGVMLALQAGWVAAGFSLSSLYFWLVPSHPSATPDDAQIVTYRLACDALSATYANTASEHLDLLVHQADLSARLMYENSDPVNGVATPGPHMVYSGYDYVGATSVAGLQPTGAEIIVDAAMRSLTAQGYTVTRAPKLDYLDHSVLDVDSTVVGLGNTIAVPLATAATQATTAATNTGTILNRLGAWTGTGINTILGALRALANKAAALTPTDLSTGGTFDNTEDSLEAIRDHGDSSWGGGGGSGLSGPSQVTLTFKDANSNIVPAVAFRVVGVGPGQTDGTGSRTFGLPDGEYTVIAGITNGVMFSGYTLTVSGTTAATITGFAPSIASTGNAAQTMAYCSTFDGRGTLTSGVVIAFRLVDPIANLGSFERIEFTAASDNSGLLQVPLLKNAKYVAKRGNGDWKQFQTGAADTFALPGILSIPPYR